MELTAEELRVLGCLVEKEATTPDNYPLSTNALVNAANQSTNREPIMTLSERDVDAVLLDLRDKGLARTIRGDGQRVNKHKHVLHEVWQLAPDQLAVLSVLILRGAQTAAELRARTERYGAGLDTAGTEAALAALAARDEPLARQLPRRPGERESRWIHLLGDHLALAPAVPGDRAPDEAPRVALSERVAALEAQVAALAARLDAIEQAADAAHAP